MNARVYKRIDGNQHVVRRCGFQVIERDADSKEVIGLHPSAMSLRTNISERYLSVNLLVHCPGTKVERLKAVVAMQRAKMRGSLSPNSGVAVIKTERLLEIGNDHDCSLTVRLTPSKIDPSYSRVTGLPLDNSNVSLVASLADEAYEDFILLADLDAQS